MHQQDQVELRLVEGQAQHVALANLDVFKLAQALAGRQHHLAAAVDADVAA